MHTVRTWGGSSTHGRRAARRRASNAPDELTERYDEAIADADADVLALPTTPQTAHERRDHLTRLEVIERALNMLDNTAPFDVTGHPAISVPAGESDGLPVGLMFVGERFEDATVLGAGRAFEEHVGWEWQDE